MKTTAEVISDVKSNNPGLCSIELGKILTQADCQQLENALKGNKYVTSIHLHDQFLSNLQVNALYSIVNTNKKITQLRLTRCTFIDESIVIFFKLMKENTTLTSLQFAGLKLSTRAIKKLSAIWISKSTVKSVYLGEDTPLTLEIANILVTLIKTNTLETLTVNYSHLQENHLILLLNAIKDNTSLKEVSIANSNSLIASLKLSTKAIKKLSAIWISKSRVKSVYLGENTPLTLEITNILVNLIEINMLETLTVNYSHLQEEHLILLLNAIKDNTSLKEVSIANSSTLTEASFMALTNMLENNSTLCKIAGICNQPLVKKNRATLLEILKESITICKFEMANPPMILGKYLARNNALKNVHKSLTQAASNRDLLGVSKGFSQIHHVVTSQNVAGPNQLQSEIVFSLWESGITIDDNNVKISFSRLMLWMLRFHLENPLYNPIINSCISILQNQLYLLKTQQAQEKEPLRNDWKMLEYISITQAYPIKQTEEMTIKQLHDHPGFKQSLESVLFPFVAATTIWEILSKDQTLLNNYAAEDVLSKDQPLLNNAADNNRPKRAERFLFFALHSLAESKSETRGNPLKPLGVGF